MAVMALVVIAAVVTFQTNWFKNKLRGRVVAALEQASGGTVELGGLDYNWHTLTAEFRKVIVRGSERADSAPLFRANSIDVGLRIVSVIDRNIDIASLIVDRPEVHLVFAADGSTNIPSPRLGRRTAGETLQSLLNLKVRHFEFRDGSIDAEAKHLPLTARGDGLFVLLTYERLRHRYSVTIRSRQMQVDSAPWRSLNVQLDAGAELERDRVVIRRAKLTHAASSLEASGELRDFAAPSAVFKLSSRIQAADLASIPAFSHLRSGELTFEGAAHYEASTSLAVSGIVTGRQITYNSRIFPLQELDFQSDVTANGEQAIFSRLTISALGAHVTGRAETIGYRQLQLDGRLSGLSVSEAGFVFCRKRLPWSGTATGLVHIESSLVHRSPGFMMQTKLQIAPGSGGIPLSGDVDSTYLWPGNSLEITSSHLQLPNTQLSLSGTVGKTLLLVLDSRRLDEVNPALSLVGLLWPATRMPELARNGSAHFDGTIVGAARDPQITGTAAFTSFRIHGEPWDQFRSHVIASANSIEFSSMSIDRGGLHATGSGRLGLDNWTLRADSPMQVQGEFKRTDLGVLARSQSLVHLPILHGIASGSIDLRGSFLEPQGTVQLAISNLDAYGQMLHTIELAATLTGDSIRIERGRVESAAAVVSFSGTYKHGPGTWNAGDARIALDSNAFPLASLTFPRRYMPGLDALLEVHGEAAMHIAEGRVELTHANGSAILRHLTVKNVPYGDVLFDVTTHGTVLETKFSGDLRGSQLSGKAQVQLTPGNPTKGEVQLAQIDFRALSEVLNPAQMRPLPVRGFLSGRLAFEGELEQPEKWHSTASINQLELTSNVDLDHDQAHATDLIFRNLQPILLDATNGIASIRSFQIGGKDTRLTVSGWFPYLPSRSMNLNVNGAMDLRFFQLLDPNVQAAGESVISASVGGVISSPSINGTVQLKNGSFAFRDVPNGLTAVNGTVQFDRDRATIQRLTAQTGGGELSLAGFVSFGGAGPLVYQLEAKADNVRVRYAGGVSVTGNSDLRLTGTSEHSVLSGTATISRAVLSPNTDFGNVLASAEAPVESPGNEKDFFTGMQFDVHVESSPNLQFNTALSRDLQAEVDLRLRGTAAHPILLGSVVANQGDIKVFGTRYSINRGEVSFVNQVKIEPLLNLDLQTQAHGIAVDITISGTLSKLNINYRSDPPLQPRDIIALLAVGHTPDVTSNLPNAQVSNDVSGMQSGADTLLGEAISPSPSRLSKLFGITNIKIDPMVQGITNTPQARLTIEQSVSRQITVTYITNLAETSEQIFRLEWAFSPQYSVVAVRDDNGEFGIDVQYRKRFK